MQKEEKIKIYEKVIPELESILNNQDNEIAIMATISCVLSQNLNYFFWTGFYRVVKEKTLVIGPYQGTLGCLEIPFSKGVCGHCATIKKTVIVPNTHKFKGHIACDSRSLSEIVVPVFDKKNNLIAVFDIDSTEENSFDNIDKKYLEKIMKIFFWYRKLFLKNKKTLFFKEGF